MTAWELPTQAVIGGKTYAIHADFRDILHLQKYLNDPDLPDFMRWRTALALFYDGDIPQKDQREAGQWLADFLRCGEEPAADEEKSPQLIDWDRDAQLIIAEINKVAGQEVRRVPFVHWWTFVAWFNGVGEGQLATVVSIREKLRTRKKLEKWEQQYYRKNKSRIDIRRPESEEEKAEKARLLALLDGK